MLDQTHPDDEQLNEYLDGFLSEAKSIVLESHLETCDLCASRLDELRDFIQELEALPDLPLERDLVPGVLAAIQPVARNSSPLAVSPAFRLVLLSQAVIALVLFISAWPIIAVWFGERVSDQFMLQMVAWRSVLLIAVSLLAFFVVLNVFFPGRISRARQAAQDSPGRSLLLGVINLAFFGAISLAVIALSSWLGEVPFLQVIGLIFLIIPGLAALFGLAGLAEMAGERLAPEKSTLMRTTWGTLALTLACALPFVGWLALLPYLVLLGLGAFILSLTSRQEMPAAFDPALGEMPVPLDEA